MVKKSTSVHLRHDNANKIWTQTYGHENMDTKEKGFFLKKDSFKKLGNLHPFIQETSQIQFDNEGFSSQSTLSWPAHSRGLVSSQN